MKISWSRFSKKSIAERIAHLRKYQLLQETEQQLLEQAETLSPAIADQMSENVIGTFALPYSIVPDVLVDGTLYQVPFVTEEPSVVAAASFASKIIKQSGGFQTQIHNREMIGQVALYDVPQHEKAMSAILAAKDDLLNLADQAHPSMKMRGGGAKDIRVETKDEFLIVYLMVDTQEAMGANVLNTMLEALSPTLATLSQGKVLMSILSNYATEALVSASCQIDLRFLSRKSDEAGEIAQKIALASKLAQVDPYRASTHNKGIFNGIDALVLATGNDWRAIQAGAHTYASRTGHYQGLTTWNFDKEKQVLEGQITLPLSIATKGGSIGLNPGSRVSFDLLGQPNAKELASVIASIGLAQNFAALKALVSTGIQEGHMKLQAKSLALIAGATETEVPFLVKALLENKRFTLDTAKAILKELRTD
ncbi:hydroxymethylglutaryl-CoA reductase, degradative [Streptococcus himalayensis]|uniref:3-hydroxy-3-methylglutaryl coenzyme A reductase n=1 Tax=Streptococcus himalayensis TaxID=1888195 RepID=A0A917A3B6_9STRE|nr:hydroxymethylglutaryl-CoA reductase, degradative [Streptococcus himalayensis]GGE24466.1 3-hydroxy-3-methylglutaryl coenzyme A reductase [Streptococcus himalayensis]